MISYYEINEEKIEILNVSAMGNCLYESICVALVFQNGFYSWESVKNKIIEREIMLWRDKAAWFKKLFTVHVEDEYLNDFQGYIANKKRYRSWGSFLEISVACDTYKMDIKIYQPKTEGVQRFTFDNFYIRTNWWYCA